ncbi:hypothetical protein A3Q56_01255 [Intoshia linei]|uniref:Anaphase-promoting complex subunit 1 beta-sandwich domain-containing protein n=1 Tax=Intoshia linei TaxID=1819745 RepID=A0A177BBI1_9BILA|nr:hypothetical protein A3Q56_01255 [Intoshia linei]
MLIFKCSNAYVPYGRLKLNEISNENAEYISKFNTDKWMIYTKDCLEAFGENIETNKQVIVPLCYGSVAVKVDCYLLTPWPGHWSPNFLTWGPEKLKRIGGPDENIHDDECNEISRREFEVYWYNKFVCISSGSIGHIMDLNVIYDIKSEILDLKLCDFLVKGLYDDENVELIKNTILIRSEKKMIIYDEYGEVYSCIFSFKVKSIHCLKMGLLIERQITCNDPEQNIFFSCLHPLDECTPIVLTKNGVSSTLHNISDSITASCNENLIIVYNQKSYMLYKVRKPTINEVCSNESNTFLDNSGNSLNKNFSNQRRSNGFKRRNNSAYHKEKSLQMKEQTFLPNFASPKLCSQFLPDDNIEESRENVSFINDFILMVEPKVCMDYICDLYEKSNLVDKFYVIEDFFQTKYLIYLANSCTLKFLKMFHDKAIRLKFSKEIDCIDYVYLKSRKMLIIINTDFKYYVYCGTYQMTTFVFSEIDVNHISDSYIIPQYMDQKYESGYDFKLEDAINNKITLKKDSNYYTVLFKYGIMNNELVEKCLNAIENSLSNQIYMDFLSLWYNTIFNTKYTEFNSKFKSFLIYTFQKLNMVDFADLFKLHLLDFDLIDINQNANVKIKINGKFVTKRSIRESGYKLFKDSDDDKVSKINNMNQFLDSICHLFLRLDKSCLTSPLMSSLPIICTNLFTVIQEYEIQSVDSENLFELALFTFILAKICYLNDICDALIISNPKLIILYNINVKSSKEIINYPKPNVSFKNVYIWLSELLLEDYNCNSPIKEMKICNTVKNTLGIYLWLNGSNIFNYLNKDMEQYKKFSDKLNFYIGNHLISNKNRDISFCLKYLEKFDCGFINNLKNFLKYPISKILNIANSNATKIPLKMKNLFNRKDISACQQYYHLKLDVSPIYKIFFSKTNCCLTGYENIKYFIPQIIFESDERFSVILDLLDVTKPLNICVNEKTQTDSNTSLYVEQLKKLLRQRISLFVGRAAVLIGSNKITTQFIGYAHINFSGIVDKSNIPISYEPKTNNLAWPLFNSGVEMGLKSKYQFRDQSEFEAKIVNDSAINNPITSYAGYLFGLAINEKIVDFSRFLIHDYLSKHVEFITISVLFVIAIVNRGTGDVKMCGTLAMHSPSLYPDENVTWPFLTNNIIITALFSFGLLFEKTRNRIICCKLLKELSNPTHIQDSMLPEIDSYFLTAGFSLALVMTNEKLDYKRLVEMKLPETLFECINYSTDNRTNKIAASIGAIIAMGFIFQRTNHPIISKWLEIPNNIKFIQSNIPNVVYIRCFAYHIVNWNSITPSVKWIKNFVPSLITHRIIKCPDGDMILDSRHIEVSTINDAWLCIIGGTCYAIAIKYAGSRNLSAYRAIKHYVYTIQNILFDQREMRHNILISNILIDRVLSNLILYMSLIMAGSGYINILSIIQFMLKRINKPTEYDLSISYGCHMCLGLAMGFLFLGCGSYTIEDSHQNVIFLACSIYPIWPSFPGDNLFHFQPFRHFWAFSAAPRLILPFDIVNKEFCKIGIKIKYKNEREMEHVMAPLILSNLDQIDKISFLGDRFHPQVFSRRSNWKTLIDIIHTDNILYVYLQDGVLNYKDDPIGFYSATRNNSSHQLWYHPPLNYLQTKGAGNKLDFILTAQSKFSSFDFEGNVCTRLKLNVPHITRYFGLLHKLRRNLLLDVTIDFDKVVQLFNISLNLQFHGWFDGHFNVENYVIGNHKDKSLNILHLMFYIHNCLKLLHFKVQDSNSIIMTKYILKFIYRIWRQFEKIFKKQNQVKLPDVNKYANILYQSHKC